MQCQISEFMLWYLKSRLTTLNPFHATSLFLYPLETSENYMFLMFSGGIERDQCYEMNQVLTFQHFHSN